MKGSLLCSTWNIYLKMSTVTWSIYGTMVIGGIVRFNIWNDLLSRVILGLKTVLVEVSTIKKSLVITTPLKESKCTKQCFTFTTCFTFCSCWCYTTFVCKLLEILVKAIPFKVMGRGSLENFANSPLPYYRFCNWLIFPDPPSRDFKWNSPNDNLFFLLLL